VRTGADAHLGVILTEEISSPVWPCGVHPVAGVIEGMRLLEHLRLILPSKTIELMKGAPNARLFIRCGAAGLVVAGGVVLA
jgi:hypothetical protein